MKTLPFLLVAAAQSAFGAFYPIDNMREIESHLGDEVCGALVLFDIDLTLTQPSEPAGQKPNIELHSKMVKELIRQAKPPASKIHDVATTWSPHILVEDETPLIIDRLARRQIDMIAFSAASSSVKEWRYKELKRLGFDFSKTFPKTELAFPCFYKGILLTDKKSKGEVLVAFLEKMNLKHKRIVFIDDRENNLKSVEKALKENYPHIAFTGLHYKGVDNYPSKIIDEKACREVWEAIIAKTSAEASLDAQKAHAL